MNPLLKNVIQRWWIILPIFLLTLAATTFFNQRQRPVYESRSTFITNPSEVDEEDRTLTSILAMMNRDNEIITTIAEVGKSNTIRNQAVEKLGLSPEELEPMRIRSRIIAGTNILLISVTGPDPLLAQDLVTAIGEETVSLANSIYPAYQLRVLDPATLPESTGGSPIALNYLLGSGLGLFFGIGAAMLASWASRLRGKDDDLPDESLPAEDDIQAELDTLKYQFIALRKEVAETRTILQATEVEARSISYSLHELINQTNGKLKD